MVKRIYIKILFVTKQIFQTKVADCREKDSFKERMKSGDLFDHVIRFKERSIRPTEVSQSKI